MKTSFIITGKKYILKYQRKMPEKEVIKMKSFVTNKGTKLTKTANVGIFEAHCKDCGKGILKPWDKDTHKADGRCYHCQLNYEIDLKASKWIRWYAYRRLHELRNMESIEKDMTQWIEELEKNKNNNPFDETIANAMSNHNVSMEIKKNS